MYVYCVIVLLPIRQTKYRLLAVRLFSLNPSSSYLSQRDCKPRRFVTIRDWVQTRKNERLLFFLLVLTPSFIEDIYLYQQLHRAEFWKTCLKKAQIFAQKPGDSGDCGENSHRGLAVLVGLIVKLPWGGKGPTCQSLGEKAAAKAWYGQLVSLENQFTDHAGLL